MDFSLCAPALPFVLSFLTLVSRCWWTLASALPLVLSSLTLVSRCWWNLTCVDLCASTRLVFFDTGQSLLVDFGLCAPTRLIFLTLVSRCWWTLTCALPLVLSFSHWSAAVGGLWLVRFHSSCLFDTGQSQISKLQSFITQTFIS